VNKKIYIKVCAGILASCLCFSYAVWADEPAPQDVPAEEVVTEAAVRVIGEEGENSLKLTLFNDTGKDIEYIRIFEYDPEYDPSEETVRMQEALIEQGYLDDIADGSFGPNTRAAVEAFRLANGLEAEGGADKEMLTLLYGEYDDGNLLPDKEIIKDGEKVIVISKTDHKAVRPSIDVPDEPDDRFMSIPEYHAVIRFAGDETEYTLNVLPVNETEISLKKDADFAYIEYTDSVTHTPVSTFEAEKAVYDAEHVDPAPQAAENCDDGYYDDGYYDDGYDDDYDDSYYDDGWTDDTTEDVTAQDGCIEDGLFW